MCGGEALAVVRTVAGQSFATFPRKTCNAIAFTCFSIAAATAYSMCVGNKRTQEKKKRGKVDTQGHAGGRKSVSAVGGNSMYMYHTVTYHCILHKNVLCCGSTENHSKRDGTDIFFRNSRTLSTLDSRCIGSRVGKRRANGSQLCLQFLHLSLQSTMPKLPVARRQRRPHRAARATTM